MRKAHAEHNEELCRMLKGTHKYNDWVVTTAFYSALNYVKFQIFPLNLPNIGKYEDFDTYFKKSNNDSDKHEALKGLVSKNLQCGGAYRWLLDQCKTARYNEYRVSTDLAAKSLEMLEAVKSHCPKLKDNSQKA